MPVDLGEAVLKSVVVEAETLVIEAGSDLEAVAGPPQRDDAIDLDVFFGDYHADYLYSGDIDLCGTALLMAAASGHHRLTDALVAAGADPRTEHAGWSTTRVARASSWMLSV
jgi:hypothetical protein